MLDCAKQKGPCSAKPAPPAPTCPPPPRKPFPWNYVWMTGAFFTFMGLLYRIILFANEEVEDAKIIWRPRRKNKRPFSAKDLPPCVQYLILGTGAAAWAAYRAIMEHDKTAKVFFITKEDILPYRRPPMSKHMWWNPDPPDLKSLAYLEDLRRYSMYYAECKHYMDPVKFFRKKKGPAMSIATGWCVLSVDPEEHVVYVKTNSGERPIYYERMLLAPGAKAKNLSLFKSAPEGVRSKVQTLRTIRDLEIAYRKVQECKDVVILGAGLLGTELAWYIGKMTKELDENKTPPKITFMYKDRGILGNILPDYLGEWAAEQVRCENVHIMPQTMVYDAFETPDGRLELTLSNGKSFITDYVLLAVGAVPREELAEDSFLETDPINGGYVVNTELQARKHLWVAGDAASLYLQWKDTRMRMEHYVNAEEQGFIAGANMTGYWTTSNMEPNYHLKLGDKLHMEVVGEVGGCMPTIAMFKQCSEEAVEKLKKNSVKIKETVGKKNKDTGSGDTCYRKKTEEETAEFKYRYKRGIMFYLRDEIVVGMMFWNIPPIENRKEVATELLRARPTYNDVNLLAELLGFPATECLEPEVDAAAEAKPICISTTKIKNSENAI